MKGAPAGKQDVPENKGENLNQTFPSENERDRSKRIQTQLKEAPCLGQICTLFRNKFGILTLCEKRVFLQEKGSERTEINPEGDDFITIVVKATSREKTTAKRLLTILVKSTSIDITTAENLLATVVEEDYNIIFGKKLNKAGVSDPDLTTLEYVDLTSRNKIHRSCPRLPKKSKWNKRMIEALATDSVRDRSRRKYVDLTSTDDT